MKNVDFKEVKVRCSYILASFVLFLFTMPCFSQGVSINTNLAAANTSAGLDVDFANKGLLIPRVALTGTNSALPLSAHVAGMVVYNTVTISDVAPGLYYSNGTKWIAISLRAGVTIGEMQYWNGTAWVAIAAGSSGQKLKLDNSGIPIWSN